MTFLDTKKQRNEYMDFSILYTIFLYPLLNP
jgi:hypothetical protein